MNTELLQELHRHREFHIRQVNAFNFTGSIAVVGVVVSLIAKGGASAAPCKSIAVVTAILIGIAALLLMIGIPCHWIWHTNQIRKLDGYIYRALKDDSFRPDSLDCADVAGLAKEWHAAYLLPGLGITVMGLAGVFYLVSSLY